MQLHSLTGQQHGIKATDHLSKWCEILYGAKLYQSQTKAQIQLSIASSCTTTTFQVPKLDKDLSVIHKSQRYDNQGECATLGTDLEVKLLLPSYRRLERDGQVIWIA